MQPPDLRLDATAFLLRALTASADLLAAAVHAARLGNNICTLGYTVNAALSFSSKKGFDKEGFAVRTGQTVALLAWSFVLGALPGFFSWDWHGPVVPGPSDVASIALPLAALLFWGFVKEDDSEEACCEELPKGKAVAVCVALGAAATVALAAIKAVGYLVLKLGLLSADAWLMASDFTIPCEAFALWGWGFFALRAQGVDNADNAAASPRRAAALYLLGAAWPCLVLVFGLALSSQGPFMALYTGEGEPPGFVMAAVCLASGLLAVLTVKRLASTRIALTDLVALLGGLATFRASAEAGKRLVDNLAQSLPDAMYAVLAVYILLVALLCALTALIVRARPTRTPVGGPAGMAGTAGPAGPVDTAGQAGAAGAAGAAVETGEALFAEHSLTERESAVLACVLRGLTGNQIADELGISASSVGTYRKRGYEKLGVADKREFLAFAAEHEAPQADANAAQGTDDGQARKAKNLPHMLRHRVLPCAVLLFLALYHPKNYYPLSVEPYGLSTSLLAPYLAGLVLVVVGLPLCLRHEDKKPKSFAARPYMTQFDRRTTRAYRIALAAAALAAGMLLGQYWLTPIPASLYPPSIVGYVLADVSFILAAVLFIGGLSLLTKLEKGENLRAIRIMDLLGNGPRAFIARFSSLHDSCWLRCPSYKC